MEKDAGVKSNRIIILRLFPPLTIADGQLIATINVM